MTTRASRLVPPVLLLGVAFAAFNNPYTPPFRGQPDTEFSAWETFTAAFMGPNFPDVGGSTSDDAVITQTVPGAIITSTGNIYNPAGASHFVVSDQVSQDLQEVILQTSVFGTPPDYTSFVLSYVDGNGSPVSLPPTGFVNLWSGGGSVEDRFDWDLSGVSDTITAYTIEFDALGAHMSLDAVQLDTRFDDGALGENYCQAELNSTGVPASISGAGSDVVAENDLTLTMSSLPLGEFGYLINGVAQGFTANPGGSAGNLCISGPIGRHSAQVGNSGSAGSISTLVDLTGLPRPSGGAHAVAPGETWYFQGWFRDGSTSNFTDGLCVTFQ